MLEDTSTELLKSIARSRKETDVKIKSLSRLLEALDTVEGVLVSAAARFRGSGGQSKVPLIRDIIEPRMLGVHFTYFKDLPLTVSSNLVRRKLAESESELSALQKKKIRLDLCQDIISEDDNKTGLTRSWPSILPRIEEDHPCTPRIKFRKVCRDEDGAFKLAEECTYRDNVKTKSPKSMEIERSSKRSQVNHNKGHSIKKQLNKTDYPGIKNQEGENLYTDIIDYDIMEKLDNMDPKERGEYTAQFYKELFDENGWLLPAKEKDDDLRASLLAEKKHHAFDKQAEPVAKRSSDIYYGPKSPLAKLFTGKKKDRSHANRKLQSQKAVQNQKQTMNQCIYRNPGKWVSRRSQECQRQPEISQIREEDKFSTELFRRSTRKASVGMKPLRSFRNALEQETEMTSY